MTIDWKSLGSVNLDQLNDERAEQLYDQLIEFQPDESTMTADQYLHLFQVTRTVMQVKALQADVALEELDEISKKKVDKSELDALRRELDIYKATSSAGGGGTVGSHSQSSFGGYGGLEGFGGGGDLTARLREANVELYQMREAVTSCDARVGAAEERAREAERVRDTAQSEINSLRAELDALRDEYEAARQYEVSVTERSISQAVDKLREKNRQIQSLIDEVKSQEDLNLELAHQVKTLKGQLKQATHEIDFSRTKLEQARDELAAVKVRLEDAERQSAEYGIRLTALSDLSTTHTQKDSDGTPTENTLKNQLATLTDMIREKDAELARLKSENLNEFQLSKLRDKYSRKLQERTEQCQLLRTQLTEAIADIEQQTEMIMRLKRENELYRKDCGPGTTVAELSDRLKEASRRSEELQEELEMHIREISVYRQTIHMYESGEYGLSDALAEIDHLEKIVRARDSKLSEVMTTLQATQEELVALCEGKLRVEDSTYVAAKKKLDRNRSERLKILDLEQELLRVEDEKISAMEEIRRLRGGASKGKPVSEHEASQDDINPEEWVRLRQENEDLQLGLREVLSSIQRTDIYTDLIIECPSLERVIRALEMRHIVNSVPSVGSDANFDKNSVGGSTPSSLGPIISLKAELDLVRGHNEQLRSELKRMRIDYITLIAQYTNDMSELTADSHQNSHDTSGPIFKSIGSQTETAKTADGAVQCDHSIEKKLSTDVQTPPRSIPSESVSTQTQPTEPHEDSLPPPTPICTITVDSECQTDPSNMIDTESSGRIPMSPSEATPTDGMPCQRCEKHIALIGSLKNIMGRLENSIRGSEEKYFQHFNRLQAQNEYLNEEVTRLEEEIRSKSEQQSNNQRDTGLSASDQHTNVADLHTTSDYESLELSTAPFLAELEKLKEVAEQSDQSTALRIQRGPDVHSAPSRISPSTVSVLHSVINCLQARIRLKDETNQQLRELLASQRDRFTAEVNDILQHRNSQMVGEQLEVAVQPSSQPPNWAELELSSDVRQNLS